MYLFCIIILCLYLFYMIILFLSYNSLCMKIEYNEEGRDIIWYEFYNMSFAKYQNYVIGQNKFIMWINCNLFVNFGCVMLSVKLMLCNNNLSWMLWSWQLFCFNRCCFYHCCFYCCCCVSCSFIYLFILYHHWNTFIYMQ